MPSFSSVPQIALTAIVFLVMISVLVAAHEFGHYLFARCFGMGVEEFAIGFGNPKLLVWMRRHYSVRDSHDPNAAPVTDTTDFTIRPLPLGGFVRIKGMMPEDDGAEVRIPGGFYNKAPWKRLLVLFAGPLFSVLAGILILIPLYAFAGVERLDNTPVINRIVDGKPASKVLETGDQILSVDGDPVRTFYDFIVHVRQSGDKPIHIEVKRHNEVLNVAVTPQWNEGDTPVLDENLDPTGELKRQATIGIRLPDVRMVRLPLGEAAIQAITEPARALRSVLGLFSKPKDFDQTVSGPATMVLATNEAINQGPYQVLWLSAILSISVGIFNLLPFAPLDGGQMFIAFAELLRGGKRLSMQVQTTITAVGAMLVVALVLSAWFVDFRRQFSPSDGKPVRYVPTKPPEAANGRASVQKPVAPAKP